MTGKDALETMYRMAEMSMGETFTIYVKLTDAANFRKEGDQAGETIEGAVREEGQKIKQPACARYEGMGTISRACFEIGYLF